MISSTLSIGAAIEVSPLVMCSNKARWMKLYWDYNTKFKLLSYHKQQRLMGLKQIYATHSNFTIRQSIFADKNFADIYKTYLEIFAWTSSWKCHLRTFDMQS